MILTQASAPRYSGKTNHVVVLNNEKAFHIASLPSKVIFIISLPIDMLKAVMHFCKYEDALNYDCIYLNILNRLTI